MARERRDTSGKVDLPADTGEGEDLGDFTGVQDGVEENLAAREADDLDLLRTLVDAGRPANADHEGAKRLEAKGLVAPKAGEVGLWPTKRGEAEARKSLRREG